MSSSLQRVLIAEDNRVMSDVVCFNLERSGISVEAVYDGRKALRRLQETHFDALLSDYQMPEMDGVELCRSVRKSGPNQDIPIVMISAKGYELDISQLTNELRLSRIIYKPFSPRQVIEAVQRVLSGDHV